MVDRFRKNCITFHENPSRGSRVIPSGRTNRWDKHDNARNCFCSYFEKAPKMENSL